LPMVVRDPSFSCQLGAFL